MKIAKGSEISAGPLLKALRPEIIAACQGAGKAKDSQFLGDLNNALMRAKPASDVDVRKLLEEPLELVAHYRQEQADKTYVEVHNGTFAELQAKAANEPSIAEAANRLGIDLTSKFVDPEETYQIIQTFPSKTLHRVDGWQISGGGKTADFSVEIESLACNGTRAGEFKVYTEKKGQLPIPVGTSKSLHDGFDDGNGDVGYDIEGTWSPSGYTIHPIVVQNSWANEDIINKLDTILAKGKEPSHTNLASVSLASFMSQDGPLPRVDAESALERWMAQAEFAGVHNIDNVMLALIRQDPAMLDKPVNQKVTTDPELVKQAVTFMTMPKDMREAVAKSVKPGNGPDIS